MIYTNYANRRNDFEPIDERLDGKTVYRFDVYVSSTGKIISRKPSLGIIDFKTRTFYKLNKNGTKSKKGSWMFSNIYADTEKEAIEFFNKLIKEEIANREQIIKKLNEALL